MSQNRYSFLVKIRSKKKSKFFILSGDLHVQALINLADNLEEDGGFIIVPDFNKEFVSFVKSTKKTLGKKLCGNFCVLPRDEPIYEHAIRVTCRAGSVVVWARQFQF